MRKAIDVAAVLALIGAAYCLFLSSRNPAQTGNADANEIPAPAGYQTINTTAAPTMPMPATQASSPSPSIIPSTIPPQPASLAARAGQLVPASTAAYPLPANTVLQNMRRAIHQYSETFGGNPVGTNPEITSQLTGNNPKHMNFVTAEAGMSVNGDGELVDPWGTPYFFHQISGAEMEIHSAGPDKTMWTPDDLVVK
jgi:hypothetical protein